MTDKPVTTFWRTFTKRVIIYLAVGAFLEGAAAAHYENKCHALPPVSSADRIVTLVDWLPSLVGYSLVLENGGIPICQINQ